MASLNSLNGFEEVIEDAVDPIVVEFQQRLLSVAGWRGKTLRQNKAAAQRIQKIAHQIGCLFVCAKEGCGRPASFRCVAVKGSETGHFQYLHTSTPTTSHGAGGEIPELIPVRVTRSRQGAAVRNGTVHE